MFERFTERARKAMALANQEAQRFHHEYIGTEHILLGLVKEAGGVAASVLKQAGVDLDRVRAEVTKLVREGPADHTVGRLPQTPRAKKVIEYAIMEARELDHHYVGTEHLLLGLLREDDGVAAQVLRNLGLELDSARKQVIHLLGGDDGIHDDTQVHPTTPVRDMIDRLMELSDTCKAHMQAAVDSNEMADARFWCGLHGGLMEQLDKLFSQLCEKNAKHF